MNAPPDWLSEIAARLRDAGEEFDLGQLRPGDILVVQTQHTPYGFRIVEGRRADLQTDRPDRPSGRVQIQGCTFGASSSIKPDALFCGGNLEFTFDDGHMVHRTTAIRSLHFLSSSSPD